MAQSSWPSPDDDRTVTDMQYEQLAGRFSDDGIYGSPADPAAVTAGPGLSVTVRAGVYGSLRGHGWHSGTSDVTLPVDANASGTARVDRVVLRLDRATWTVRAAVKTGTPGAGPPALTQQSGDTGVWEIPLAQATLLGGAGVVTVARRELYVGSRVRPCTSATRPPLPAPGEIAMEVDTGRTLQWTGDTWRLLSDDSGEITVNAPLSAWSNEVDCILERRAGVVHLRLGSFQRKAGTLAGSDESRLPVLIPAAYRHKTRDQYALAYVSGVDIGRLIIYSAASDRPGQVWLVNKPSIASGEFVLPASGPSWTVSS